MMEDVKPDYVTRETKTYSVVMLRSPPQAPVPEKPIVRRQQPQVLQLPRLPQRTPYTYNLTPEQIARLEAEYTRLKTLHETDLALLAFEMGAGERDVQAWYTERVGTWRREQGLSDCFGQV